MVGVWRWLERRRGGAYIVMGRGGVGRLVEREDEVRG